MVGEVHGMDMDDEVMVGIRMLGKWLSKCVWILLVVTGAKRSSHKGLSLLFTLDRVKSVLPAIVMSD